MNRFIISFLGLGLVIILPFLIEIFILPIDFFHFRIWESIKLQKIRTNPLSPFVGPFYPNKKIRKVETGDLGHHSPFAVNKNVEWYTDSIGFRNIVYRKKPDVLFIGDSNTVGSSLDQKDIISQKFEDNTDLLCYNIAPANIRGYIQLYRTGLLDKPKIIVLSMIERGILRVGNIPKSDKPLPVRKVTKSKFELPAFFAELLDRMQKENMKNYINARIKNKRGKGQSSTIDENFLYTKSKLVKSTKKNLDLVTNGIKSFDTFCKKEGIIFIVFPIPNKETIFFEHSIFVKEQPDFLDKLDDRLKENGIRSINTFKLFNQAKENGVMMYQMDDTHWNEIGVELVADELEKLINLIN